MFIGVGVLVHYGVGLLWNYGDVFGGRHHGGIGRAHIVTKL